MKSTFALHRGWEFADAPYGVIRHPEETAGLTFLPARVPGTNLEDLQRNRRMPPPFHRDYEAAFAPFRFRDFIYRLRFAPPEMTGGRRTFLCFEGLDTVCEIFLNGEFLATTENAFLRHRFEVTDRLRPQANELVLIFRAPVPESQKRQKAYGIKFPAHLDLDFMFLRKPAYSFFWDWAPEIPVSGIYRPVFLTGRDFAEIIDLHVRYELRGENVEGIIVVECEGAMGGRLRVQLGGETFSAPQDRPQVRIPFRLAHIEPWFPNGMGTPRLYDLKVDLLDPQGKLCDRRTQRIGFRKVELLQDSRQNGRGTRFRFRINGRQVYVRGYNWVPLDSSLPRGYARRYRNLLELAEAGGVNMLRIWGGGFYEDRRFYEACDRLGIMVFQDAMFACSLYPDTDPSFLQNVEAELRENIRRLRNHPSLVLWSGGNETRQGWEDWWQEFRKQHPRFYGAAIYHELLPRLLRELDPDRLYIPNSPHSPDSSARANAPFQGDFHFWKLHTNCGDYTEYRKIVPSFVAETGIQCFPDIMTARRIGTRADRHFLSFVFDSRNHFERPAKNERLLKFMAALFRIPEDFEQQVFLSMLAQADYLRYAVEHWRSHAFDNGGVLIWQFNDCWPAISWSVVDYDLRPKAAFYALRRAFASPNVFFRQEHSINYDPQRECRGSLAVVSDEPIAAAEVVAEVMSLQGERRWEKRISLQNFNPGANPAGEIAIPDFAKIRFDSFLDVSLVIGGKPAARNRYTLSRPKHMRLPLPHIRLKSIDEVTVEVCSDVFARAVYLCDPRPGVFFDENFLDLAPGETRRLRANRPISLEKLRVFFYHH